MYERARQSDRVTMVCPPPHAMLGDLVVKELLANGYVGKLYHVNVVGLQPAYLDPNAPLHWRQDTFISGYNTLILGMLIEVLHRWVGYFESITADVAYLIPRRRKEGSVQEVDVRVPDSLGVVGRLKNGALAVFSMSGVARAGETRFELYGSNGTLRYLVDSNRILGASGSSTQLEPIEIPPDKERHWTAEADFVRAIREGGPVTPDFEEGLRYMEVTEAIYRSARSHQTVTLPLAYT
jgi:predicted dehydrogenase